MLLDRWSSPPAGDSYYGVRATEYESVRMSQVSWQQEQDGLELALSGIEGVGNVLDVPVGTGRFFSVYKNLGFQITGLDASEEMLAESNNQAIALGLYPTLVKGDAKKMMFSDNSFDLVVCFRFLHSIISLGAAREVLREFARVTRKYVLLEIGIRDSSTPRRFTPSEKAAMRDKLSNEEVSLLLRDSGLSILRVFGPFEERNKAQYALLCEKAS